MLAHECRVDRAGDRTLVEVVVANETTVDRRVRVENCLDGRVEPPRENGVPTPGWDDEGYTGVVPANGRLTLGYACAAPPTDPPVAVRDEGRPAEGDDADEPTAADAVRLLDDHAPPADAVPVDGAEASDPATNGDTDGSSADEPPAPVTAMVDRLDEGDATSDTAPADGTEPADAAPATDSTGPNERAEPSAVPPDAISPPEPTEEAADPSPSEAAPDDLPPAAASWFADVRGRVADAETLAAGDLAAVARVVDERGGAAEAAALDAALADDEERLRALATELEALADRAAEAAVPVAALRRLS